MKQQAQMTRSDSDNFNDLPSDLRNQFEINNDFDIFSSGPNALLNESHDRGRRLSVENSQIQLLENSYLSLELIAKSPLNKIKGFWNLENIAEEESYELDNSRLTEKVGSFNDLDKFSFRPFKKSNDNLFEGLSDDFSKAKKSLHMQGKAAQLINDIIKSQTKGYLIDKDKTREKMSLPSNPESQPDKSKDDSISMFPNIEGGHQNFSNKKSNKENFEHVAYSLKQAKSAEGLRVESMVGSENKSNKEFDHRNKNDKNFEKKSKELKSDKEFTENFNLTEKSSNSAINIYQNNNILINITNDTSNNISISNQLLNKTNVKNIYFDLNKFPSNAFSKKKENQKISPSKEREGGRSSEARSEIPLNDNPNVSSMKCSQNQSTVRTSKLSSSLGFDKLKTTQNSETKGNQKAQILLETKKEADRVIP
jgi:hypothetical protein